MTDPLLFFSSHSNRSAFSLPHSRWDGEAPVWRVECRLKREALHEMEIEEAYRALDQVPALWAYCVGQPGQKNGWVRMIDPNTRDTNRRRWNTASKWIAVQKAFMQHWRNGEDVEAIQRERKRQINLDRAEKAIAGYTTTYAAWLQKDGRYSGFITLETGKRKYFYGKTKSEVKKQIKKAQREQEQDMLIVGPQQTVAQYLEDWLQIHRQTIRPRSYERYEQLIRLHIVPMLGKLPLQKLSAQHLQRLYAQKLNNGLSSTTVSAIHNMLHSALDNAVKIGTLSRNVCKSVTPPRKIHKEIHPLTPEQIHLLLEAARGHRQEALFVLTLATGMRRGELIGLKWSDIDFDKRILHVRRSLTRMPTGLGLKESEPKTKKSRRSIVLIPFAVEALRKHRARQLEMKAVAGDAWQDHDYVFCGPTGKHLSPGHDVLVQLKKLLNIRPGKSLPV